MSKPATSWSRRYTDRASVYCSRNLLLAIASTNDRVPRFSVYQLGRGSEPIIVVGRILSLVARNIFFMAARYRACASRSLWLRAIALALRVLYGCALSRLRFAFFMA